MRQPDDTGLCALSPRGEGWSLVPSTEDTYARAEHRQGTESTCTDLHVQKQPHSWGCDCALQGLEQATERDGEREQVKERQRAESEQRGAFRRKHARTYKLCTLSSAHPFGLSLFFYFKI